MISRIRLREFNFQCRVGVVRLRRSSPRTESTPSSDLRRVKPSYRLQHGSSVDLYRSQEISNNLVKFFGAGTKDIRFDPETDVETTWLKGRQTCVALQTCQHSRALGGPVKCTVQFCQHNRRSRTTPRYYIRAY
jgi:hypothetical protein